MIKPTQVKISFNGEVVGQFNGEIGTAAFNLAHRTIREQFFLNLQKPAEVSGVVVFGKQMVKFKYKMTENDHPRRIEREILKSWFLDRDKRLLTHDLGYDEVQLKFLQTELGVK